MRIEYRLKNAVEIVNPKGEARLFEFDDWHCCRHLKAINGSQPMTATVALLSSKTVEMLSSTAFGRDSLSCLVLEATPNFIDWYGTPSSEVEHG